MNASAWAGWVGACTGVVSFGWQVYTKVTTGPRLRVSVVTNLVQRPAPPGDPKLLRITVENTGTAPTTIQCLVFETYLSRWAKLRHQPSSPHGYIPEAYEGPQLPYRLEVGGEFVAHIEQDEDFDKWASSGNLWCGVIHSFSTRPVLGKVFVGPKE